MPTPTPTIYPYALTTLERVKTRLTITVDTFDSFLIRLANSVTDTVERELGLNVGHHIVLTTYTNEVYSVGHNKQAYLILRAAPVRTLSSFEWRAGTPSNPSWTPFIIDQYELKNPQPAPNGTDMWYPSGIIRVYGVLPRIYDNMLRATYSAGYAVDWENEGTDTHELPGDLSQLADDLIVRWWKRRELAGQTAQSLQGQTVSNWKNMIDQDDKDILDRYKRPQFF